MRKVLLLMIATMSCLAEPRAIVFDFGGLMIGQNNRDAVVAFLRESFHLNPSEFEKINLQKRLAVKQGKTDEEFWFSYAQEKGVQLPPNWKSSFKASMKDSIGINPSMYVLLDQTKGKKLSLSNVDERLCKLVRDFGFYEPFNPSLLSCEIAFEKPDPKAYEFMLAKLNLPAGDVIFIDDRKGNIDAAKTLGLDAILFESEAQLKAELKKRGILE